MYKLELSVIICWQVIDYVRQEWNSTRNTVGGGVYRKKNTVDFDEQWSMTKMAI